MEVTKPANPDPRTLLGQLRSQIRVRHYSLHTEETCVHWTRRYHRFHGRRHPREIGPKEVLGMELPRLDGTHALMARLLYGTGMRLWECLPLRVKDVEFAPAPSGRR